MKKHFVLIILLLTSLFAYAEDDDYLSLFGDSGSSDSSEETQSESSSSSFGDYDFSAIPDFKLSLFGDHKSEFRMPVLPDHFNFDSYIKAPKFRNNLGIEVNYKSLKLVSSFKFDIILKQSAFSETAPNQWQEILNVMPMENYISWSPWKIKFAAGLQTFSWGAADGMNPTDNINPRDYRFGADSEKICHGNDDGEVRETLFLLPFAHRLGGDAQLVRQLLLGQGMQNAQPFQPISEVFHVLTSFLCLTRVYMDDIKSSTIG